LLLFSAVPDLGRAANEHLSTRSSLCKSC